MQHTLGDIAERLNLTVKGDASCIITGLATLQQAGQGQLAFLDSATHASFLPQTQASAVILSEQHVDACPTNAIITDNPRLAYAKIATLFAYQNPQTGIHPTAVIGENCQLADTVSVGAHCVLGDGVILGDNVILEPHSVLGDHVVVGANTRLMAHVTLYHHVQLGERVTIHSGTVVGSDGFGYAKDGEAWRKIPQLGTVIIHNDVEVGANTVIDRGALDDTVIGRGVILDNLIQIAHNVRIGDYTAIAGCVGIAGSAVIGKHCSIGGGTGIAGHIEITDYVMLTGMSMVTNSIKQPGVYSSGTGVQPNRAWKKSVIRFQQSDKLAKRVQSLEKQIQRKVKGEMND